MTILHLLFGFGGRVDRTQWAVAMIVVGCVFWGGLRASEAMLPAMASVLSPRGINAGLVLNVLWSMLWLFAVWSAIALTAKRLRTVGRSPWWAAAAILPFAILAQINDAIFLVSRTLVAPIGLQYAVMTMAGLIALWVLYETLRPETGDRSR